MPMGWILLAFLGVIALLQLLLSLEPLVSGLPLDGELLSARIQVAVLVVGLMMTHRLLQSTLKVTREAIKQLQESSDDRK